MISSETLNPLILSAFSGKITWLEASTKYPLDEFIETFYHTRQRVQENLQGLTDAQMAFASEAHSLWSISESVTHLVYTQGYYLNKLLDISTSQLPHIVEAARGFGEGARQNIRADELRKSLLFATEQIEVAIDATRNSHDPAKTDDGPFGVCTYKTWVALMLSHEIDHLRQIVAMRRQARTST